jgi:predicted Rossmann-fold nucleotide-binding protein
MSGYPKYNYPLFESTTSHLRNVLGLEVRSPHECEPEPEGTDPDIIWKNMMEKCLFLMEECNSIILLPGWENSTGANIELGRALDWKWVVHMFDFETQNLRLVATP